MKNDEFKPSYSPHRFHRKSDFLKSLFKVYEDYDIESLLTLRDGLSVIIRSKHTGNYDFENFKGYVVYD